MNILPKKYSQFKQKQYWDSFFQQLRSQNKNFEWYGTLKQYRNNLFFTLNSIYNRNNKQKSISIAHLGCGNSTLAQEIAQAYQIFDFSILNLDYSEAVIEQMRVRSKQKAVSEKIKYEVCNLLKPISEQLSNRFDMVLDKGTLDAILPQDDKANIKQIQEVYFENVVQMLKKGTCGSYVIISMLQQFIIRTILEAFKNRPHFTITISECTIPNSQLQPFFIEIFYNPLQQAAPITLNLLNKTVLKSQSKQEIQEKITEVQRLAAFTSNIKQLRNGQIARFNILVPGTNRIRYMLDIVDNSSQAILSKNNCAVFIVPPGMEAQFAADHSLKDLQEQIGMSRTIFAKLVIGQSCKSVQEVRSDLNPILANLIQKGCNVKEVPYLTDGSFSERQYLYRDQEIFIEQVLSNGQGFRRLILKNAPSLIQSQFKLTYTSTKSNHEIVSAALPAKKGLSIGIDENNLDQSYCRTIYTGLSRLVNLKQSRGLHLGGGACTIAKFLHHKYPQMNQLIVQSSKSVITNCAKYFDWPQQSKGFEVINAQASKFIRQLSQDEKFDYIIVDINNKEQIQQFYPPLQFFEKQFVRKCANALKDEGVIVYNTIQLDQIQVPPPYEKLLFQTTSITQVYKSKTSKENVVYFAAKNKITPQQREGVNILVMKNLFKLKNKVQFSWQEEQIAKIQLVQPESGTLFKQLGLKVVFEVDEQKKKKKKKK